MGRQRPTLTEASWAEVAVDGHTGVSFGVGRSFSAESR
jgi:hypothetical protein